MPTQNLRGLTQRLRISNYLNQFFSDNLSYKLVSLFIALILWLTILGRRDFVLSRTLDVEVLVGSGQVIAGQNPEHVKVKVVGPRTALRKFTDSGLSQQITVDATMLNEGEHDIEIPANKVDVPFGVKILQIKPATVKVLIRKSP